jgi:cholesterol transport system auxiliary component
MMGRAFLLASLVAFTTSCALLTKSEPVVPRYFSPEAPESVVAPVGGNAARSLSLRLGNVGGASYLKERIAYRDSDHEFGFYEDQRWTERPEVYLQRAIERSLFEERGLKRDLSVSAPTLTVELIEFEEVRGVSPRVRLRISYALHDERTVFRERSFAIERPLPAGAEASRMDRVAAALGDALREGVTRIVDQVIADLAARGAPPT